MPVGCLGSLSGGQVSPDRAPGPGALPEARGPGATPAGLAERLEVMQQTLLIQIFRAESSASLACPACQAFAPTCCQVESGWSVLAALVGANSGVVWSPGLARAVTSLRLQVGHWTPPTTL